MAKVKAVSANCPSCGAALPVMPGVPQIQCRYCQNVITIEVRQPPPNVTPFGMPGGIPSRTLYIDPKSIADAQKAAQTAGTVMTVIILATVALPLIIGLGAAFGGGCLRACTGAIRPYPVSCGINGDVDASGTWTGTGPIVTSAGVNCKIHIKDSKLTAPSFFAKPISNVEITIENSTIETTDTMFKLDSNVKLHIKNSTLKSQGFVVDAASNLEIDLDGATLESVTATAIKPKYNLKLKAVGSKIRGKKSGIDTDANMVLEISKGTEISGAEGPGIKSTSSTKIEVQSAKITGGAAALVATSGMQISGSALTVSSQKEKAIDADSGLKIELADSNITSAAEEAIFCDSGLDLAIENTTIQGTTGIETKSGLKVKATKKSRIVGTTGNGILTTSGSDITLADASIEGGALALKSTSGVKMKLQANSRVVGKRGGIYSESSFRVDGNGTSIEGGAGPALQVTSSASITLQQSVLKGNPALMYTYPPSPLDLTGTRVEGAQQQYRQ